MTDNTGAGDGTPTDAEIEDFLDGLDAAPASDDAAPASADARTSDADEAAAEVETELDLVNRELQQFKDIALRLQADFENYRKRVVAQQTDEVDRAAGRLVEALLPVLDACEAAFAHGADGVEPIWSQLMGVLQKQGLEALDLTDKVFDPALADAVAHEEGDGSEPVISDVLRTGYRWKGKVLRPAMVKVRG